MDSLWLSVWGYWILIWAATLAALITAGSILAVQWRSRAQRGQSARGMCFYLQNKLVMDLYLVGPYKTALRQEVKEEISSTKAANLTAQLRGVGGTAGKTVDRKIFREYIETAEPIAVIRIIMDVLEKANDVLYIDLLDGAVDPGRSLNKALRSIARSETARITFDELRDFEVYVWIRGRFREVAKTNSTVTFEAPCSVRDSNQPARAVVTCARAGIRRKDEPAGTFHARCLGKIQDWDRDTRRLVIDPIAIFT